MSLILLDNGWKRFGEGRLWRCQGPKWLVEVDREGNIPSYNQLAATVANVKKIRTFYSGKLSPGVLESHGTALDVLSANAMAESLGTVPTPFSYVELKNVFDNSSAQSEGDRLTEVLDYITSREKWLVRKEPGYVNPIQTPGRVSVGAHHVLISTALGLLGKNTPAVRNDVIRDLVFRLPSVSTYAAELAIKYFNDSYSRHMMEPPLLAASYNAGSIRPDPANAWNLKQYGNHVDRWVAFYNTSRLSGGSVGPVSTVEPSPEKTLEVKVIRKTFTNHNTIGELYVDEKFHCYTLEDVVREAGVKVYGETAIPPGRYKLKITFSERFQKRMPQIMDVPLFQGIRIHPGNTEKDTLGCILVGKNLGADRIWNCKGVYDSLLQEVDAFPQKDLSFITIRNQN